MKPDKPKKLNKPEKPEKLASVFRKDYADQYDLLYSDKNYKAECDMIEEVFRRYGDGPIKSLLDLGCGTGNHAIPLAQRGYQVTGVDISPDMLSIARSKADDLFSKDLTRQTKETKQTRETKKTRKTCIIKPVFLEGDLRSLNLNNTFDAVLMMFAVLGYQLTNDDVLAALQTVRRHLNPDGLFICDVWYGPAVLKQQPGERVKVIPTAEGKIVRAASGSLDTFRHICEVHYHVWQINGKQVLNESEEKHTMRYFFPQELAFFLTQAGLRIITMRTFENIDQTPSESTWDVTVIAKRPTPQNP